MSSWRSFAETLPADLHAVMVLDGAGWHGAKDLVVPDSANVTLVSLPLYSPELNPVERIWLYLRERYLSHRLLADEEAVVKPVVAPGTHLPLRLDASSPSPAYPYLNHVTS